MARQHPSGSFSELLCIADFRFYCMRRSSVFVVRFKIFERDPTKIAMPGWLALQEPCIEICLLAFRSLYVIVMGTNIENNYRTRERYTQNISNIRNV
jgi:hypothetical protein